MITSFDDYIAAQKEILTYFKSGAVVTVATAWFSLLDAIGTPAAGSLNPGNVANGLIPIDTDAGYPMISPFAVGAKGYLSSVEFSNTISCRMKIIDRLFHAGSFNFNANQVLTAQPSFLSRLPGGSYNNLELWFEAATAMTGSLTLTVSYTNQNGVSGRTASLIISAPTIRRMSQIPLQVGDTGIQKIDSVVGTIASAGTFNLIIARPLWSSRVRLANDGDVHALDKTGLPEIFSDSALQVLMSADSTSSGIPELLIEVASK